MPRSRSASGLATIVGLSAATVLGGTAAAQVAPAPDDDTRSGEYIAFVSERTGNDELFLSRPDGTEVEQLTDNPGFDRAPSWADDGSVLVFNSRREPHADRPQIYGMDVLTGVIERLTESSVEEHRASIDVAHDAVYFHRGAFFVTPFELWRKDLVTGEEAQLTESDDAMIWNAGPDVSPDGDRLVLQSNRDVPDPTGPFPQSLYVLDLVTGYTERVPRPEGVDAGVSLDGGRWSPDGDRVVYSANTDAGSQLFIADAVGSPSTWQSEAVTDPTEEASAAAWSPDGSALVYQADVDGGDLEGGEDRTELRVLDLSSGQSTSIGEGRTPAWTRIAEPTTTPEPSTAPEPTTTPEPSTAPEPIGTPVPGGAPDPASPAGSPPQDGAVLAATGLPAGSGVLWLAALGLAVCGAVAMWSARAERHAHRRGSAAG